MNKDTEKRDKKNIYMSVAAAAVCFAVLGAAALLLSRSLLPDVNAVETFGASAPAAVSPVVTDALTGEPVAGAAVVIPEAGSVSVTDGTGSAGAIPVPVNTDERFKDVLKKPWGEVTIIVYADGYIPYALFNVMVTQGTREGPTILLFKKSTDGKDTPFSIIEGPHREWVNALVEKYTPMAQKQNS